MTSTAVLDTIDEPTTILPTIDPTPKTTHRFTIDTASSVDVAEALGLSVGDEVDVALRVRVSGVSHREGYIRDDEHTITTTAKLLALHAVDDEPTTEPEALPHTCPAPSVIIDRSHAWFGWAGICFGIACLAAMFLPYVS